MAITAQQREHLVALTIVMFNAPPGADYLADFESDLEQGLSLEQLAMNLAATETFNAQFSGLPNTEAAIDQVLGNLGIGPDSSVYPSAFTFFATGLAAGRNPGLLLLEAGEFLYNTDDPEYAQVAAAFKNKIEVGMHHSVDLQLPSGNLEALQAVVADVTDEPASVDQAIAALSDPQDDDRQDDDPQGDEGEETRPDDDSEEQADEDEAESEQDDDELSEEEVGGFDGDTGGGEDSQLPSRVSLDALDSTDLVPALFDAGEDGFIFDDHVALQSHTRIENFGPDDTLRLIGVLAEDVRVQVSGDNTQIQFDDGSGQASQIELVGVNGFFTSVAEFNQNAASGDIQIA